jgi:hypothetical protein
MISKQWVSPQITVKIVAGWKVSGKGGKKLTEIRRLPGRYRRIRRLFYCACGRAWKYLAPSRWNGSAFVQALLDQTNA